MVSLTYRTQDLVKIDNESFELEHIFKCDRNILVLPHQFTKSVLGKVKRLTGVRQWGENGVDVLPECTLHAGTTCHTLSAYLE